MFKLLIILSTVFVHVGIKVEFDALGLRVSVR